MVGGIVIIVIAAVLFFTLGNSNDSTSDLNSSEIESLKRSGNINEESSSSGSNFNTGSSCGNDKCESGEAYEICPQDCPRIDPKCSNGICEGGESYESCPQDCDLTNILGTNPSDGACQPGEDIGNAPKDCTDIQPNCGNSVCNTLESKATCYEDCPFDNNGGGR